MEKEIITNPCSSVPLLLCQFSYDYMSRRTGKTVYKWDESATNWVEQSAFAYLYDGWNLISEQTHQQTNTQTNFFTWGLDLSGSLQGAGGVGGLLSAVIGTNSVCYTVDGNGNVSELLDPGAGTPSSRISAHYEYSPFGEQLVATGPLARENPFRFSTKYTDNETRLVYYGYRYYSPGLGRWVNRDPIGEDGFNVFSRRSFMSSKQTIFELYLFLLNSPVCQIDFLGLDCVCPAGSNKGKRPKPGYTPTVNGCSGVGTGPFDFTSACNGHDTCYGTCNSSRAACDQSLYDDMMNICSQNCGTDVNCLFWCGLAADTYYAGVFWGGGSYYDDAQKDACEDCCCP